MCACVTVRVCARMCVRLHARVLVLECMLAALYLIRVHYDVGRHVGNQRSYAVLEVVCETALM